VYPHDDHVVYPGKGQQVGKGRTVPATNHMYAEVHLFCFMLITGARAVLVCKAKYSVILKSQIGIDHPKLWIDPQNAYRKPQKSV
jgi:hypothetical protein